MWDKRKTMGLTIDCIKYIGKATSFLRNKSVISNSVSVFENATNSVKSIAQSNEINFQGIKSIVPTSFRKIGKNCVAGSMSSIQSPENLKLLKENGIKTIIDFRTEASKEYQQLCKEFGFKYISFPLDLVSNFLHSSIFIKQAANTRAKVSDEFVKNLKKFFKEVDKGNAYMGCMYGVHRTNTGVLLNYLLNPNECLPPVIMKIDGEQINNLTNQSLNAIKKIIHRLSPEQKKVLNISDDFLSNLYLKKIAKLKETNRLYYNK